MSAHCILNKEIEKLVLIKTWHFNKNGNSEKLNPKLNCFINKKLNCGKERWIFFSKLLLGEELIRVML